MKVSLQNPKMQMGLAVAVVALAIVAAGVKLLRSERPQSPRVVLHADETEIRGSGYQLRVPLGWAISPQGRSAKFLSSFTAQPAGKQPEEGVYFGVYEKLSAFDFDHVKAAEEEKGHAVRRIDGKGFETLIVEYATEQTRYITWYVRSRRGDFAVIAGAPASDADGVSAIRRIFDSLNFD